MIDAMLLQSFMSDIEMLRNMSNAPAGKKANSAEYDPFGELLARAMGIQDPTQSQTNPSVSDPNAMLQLVRANMIETWLNPEGSNNGSKGGGGYLTTEDIDALFPELAALNTILG
ncbi:MAG: hypothetical protein LBC63_05320 [Holophagales bacterium]|jgi:hypothetical protein|nr:hypothetical protein [Holophagales bacterium]